MENCGSVMSPQFRQPGCRLDGIRDSGERVPESEHVFGRVGHLWRPWGCAMGWWTTAGGYAVVSGGLVTTRLAFVMPVGVSVDLDTYVRAMASRAAVGGATSVRPRRCAYRVAPSLRHSYLVGRYLRDG